MNQHSPNIDPTFYRWVHDEIKIFCQVGIPDCISPAPPEVLNLIKSNCWFNKPCSSEKWTCVSSKLACSVMCQCCGDTQQCFYKDTNLAVDLLVGDED